MPRAKPRGGLDRSAAADLFRHTLARIESVYGRLSYLASLRDPVSGVYRHHGLSAMFGRDESTRAIREYHERTFREWLRLPVPEKYRDLLAFLDVLEEPRGQVLLHWKQSRPYRSFLPSGASEAEKAMFSLDLDLLVDGLTIGDAGPALRDQGSSPLQ